MKSSTVKNENQKSNIPKLRWKIILSALKGQNINRNQASIRQFTSFGLFDKREIDDFDDQNQIESNEQNNQSIDDEIEKNDKSKINEQFNQTKRIKMSNQIDKINYADKLDDQSSNQSNDQLNEDKWFYYSLNNLNADFKIKLKFTSNSKIPIKELLHGFDNTGNYLWSEEILAYFCLKNNFSFDKLNICELGCGLTGLAALTVAISSKASYVLLTDGNSRCIKNVESIIKANENLFDKTLVQCMQFKWRLMNCNENNNWDDKKDNENNDDIKMDKLNQNEINEINLRYENLKNKFDVILCSDCLYFEKSHLHLIETIYDLLNDNGIAILMAPLRSGSYKEFMKLAIKYFHMKIHIVYDELVWSLNKKFQKELTDIYKTDLHYPVMSVLQKRRKILP